MYVRKVRYGLCGLVALGVLATATTPARPAVPKTPQGLFGGSLGTSTCTVDATAYWGEGQFPSPQHGLATPNSAVTCAAITSSGRNSGWDATVTDTATAMAGIGTDGRLQAFATGSWTDSLPHSSNSPDAAAVASAEATSDFDVQAKLPENLLKFYKLIATDVKVQFLGQATDGPRCVAGFAEIIGTMEIKRFFHSHVSAVTQTVTQDSCEEPKGSNTYEETFFMLPGTTLDISLKMDATVLTDNGIGPGDASNSAAANLSSKFFGDSGDEPGRDSDQDQAVTPIAGGAYVVVKAEIPLLQKYVYTSDKINYDHAPILDPDRVILKSGTGQVGKLTGPIALRLANRVGKTVAATNATVIMLNSSLRGDFYAKANGPSIRSIIIPTGQSSTVIYYRPFKAGVVKLTASSLALTSATSSMVVRAAKP